MNGQQQWPHIARAKDQTDDEEWRVELDEPQLHHHQNQIGDTVAEQGRAIDGQLGPQRQVADLFSGHTLTLG